MGLFGRKDVKTEEKQLAVVEQSDKQLVQVYMNKNIVPDQEIAKIPDFKEKLEKVTAEADALKEAGLMAQYRVKSAEVYNMCAGEVLKESLNSLRQQGYIVVKIPEFKSFRLDHPYTNEYISFYGVQLTTGHSEVDEKYLVRCDVSSFMGETPNNVVQEIIKIKQEKMQPQIWFVSKGIEVPQYMEGSLVIKNVDPLLVALSDKMKGYAAVRAIWGKDIEDINTFFSKQ